MNPTFERINRLLIWIRRDKNKYHGWPYLMAFVLLLTVEVLIAFNYYSPFVRAYVGDMLVVILLYCLIRSFFDIKSKWLPWAVFGFAVLIELTQLMGLVEQIGAEPGSFLWVVLGSSFDWKDIASYFAGAVLVEIILEVEVLIVRPWWWHRRFPHH